MQQLACASLACAALGCMWPAADVRVLHWHGQVSWQRVRVANALASSGEEWVAHLDTHSSGTYNNQVCISEPSFAWSFQPLLSGVPVACRRTIDAALLSVALEVGIGFGSVQEDVGMLCSR